MRPGYWAILVFLLLSIGLGFYFTISERKKLDKCSKESEAVIINKYRIRKKGYTIKYRYKIAGVNYQTSESIDNEEVSYFNLGDTIVINYSCKEPNISRYNNTEL